MGAEKVGKNGAVYAIDVLNESLEVIAAKARDRQLFNIKTIRANLEKPNGSTLPDSSCDWVIVSNILFQSDQQEQIIAEALRVIKPPGKICVVDWHPEKLIVKTGHYPLDPAKVKDIAKQLKAKIKSEFEPDTYHYALIIEK